jgi:uncharacterized membrane protein YjgN (DUF898 family)
MNTLRFWMMLAVANGILFAATGEQGAALITSVVVTAIATVEYFRSPGL